jgi:hypothetical protein
MERKIISSTLTEKRDCGGLMELNLGARRTKKHM